MRRFAAFCLILLAYWAANITTVHGQVKIMSPEKLERIKKILPAVEDERIAAILKDPTTIFYDSRSMPPAYQVGIGGSLGPLQVGDPNINISGDFGESQKPNGQGGNPNIEFPWLQGPGGTERSPDVDHFKALWLPKKSDGRPWPVVWFRRDIEAPFNENETVVGFDWVFPVGATLLEVITISDSRGFAHVFEIRGRIREYDEWAVEILRPFPESRDLSRRVKELRPAWKQDRSLVRMIAHLESDLPLVKKTLSDSFHHGQRAFTVSAAQDRLPPLDEKLIKQLLASTQFTSALGATWREGGNGVSCFAPTTQSQFHIVPKNYDGTFLGSSRIGCSNCHDSSLKSARVFDNSRGWYGYVRGNKSNPKKGGGILSFHPFEPGDVRGVMRSGGTRIRRVFSDAGVVEKFSKKKHPRAVYQRL